MKWLTKCNFNNGLVSNTSYHNPHISKQGLSPYCVAPVFQHQPLSAILPYSVSISLLKTPQIDDLSPLYPALAVDRWWSIAPKPLHQLICSLSSSMFPDLVDWQTWKVPPANALPDTHHPPTRYISCSTSSSKNYPPCLEIPLPT